MICILFGAGAEQSLKLSGGAEFARKVVGDESDDITKELNNAINKHYKQVIKNINDEWYPGYVNRIWDEDDLFKAALHKKNLEEPFDSKKDYEDKVKEEYESINKLNDSNEKKNKIDEILQEYSSYMGLIDYDFHALINPKVLGPIKFWRVVSCYSRAYAYLIGQMYLENQKRIKDTDTIINEEIYYDILSDWSKAYQIMEDFAKGVVDKNYYSIIEGAKDIRVVTTNYTNLCEEIGLKNGEPDDSAEERIAYVHGKFGWFESPRELVTYNAFEDELPSKLLFPYIFIQSGIKPIVERRQLEEYSKMLSFFKDADAIIIVGYRLNYDDNHLNSILKSELVNKKVIYFDFDKLGREVILKRLKIEDNPNLEVVEINKENCLEVFEDKLKELGVEWEEQ